MPAYGRDRRARLPERAQNGEDEVGVQRSKKRAPVDNYTNVYGASMLV